jgi:hypothetical protein
MTLSPNKPSHVLYSLIKLFRTLKIQLELITTPG